MKKWWGIKYPKFITLILTIILACVIFKIGNLSFISEPLLSLGYFGTFLSGILLAYSFTAAPAVAVLLILEKGQNIFLATLVGGFGALVADLIVFKLIRNSFKNEIKKLSHEKSLRHLEKKIPNKAKRYLMLMTAELFLASPLPDEIGVTLFSLYKHISARRFAIISYITHFVGILIILLIGRAI